MEGRDTDPPKLKGENQTRNVTRNSPLHVSIFHSCLLIYPLPFTQEGSSLWLRGCPRRGRALEPRRHAAPAFAG
jgi:hypothetical protein